jgi:hypothetical protein
MNSIYGFGRIQIYANYLPFLTGTDSHCTQKPQERVVPQNNNYNL